jgi:hypothetical protein
MRTCSDLHIGCVTAHVARPHPIGYAKVIVDQPHPHRKCTTIRAPTIPTELRAASLFGLKPFFSQLTTKGKMSLIFILAPWKNSLFFQFSF